MTPPASPSNDAPTARLLPDGSSAMLTITDASRPLLRLTVRVASSEASRATGLMNVRALSDSSGLVFQFPAVTNVSFWMKDTVIPLDIAFWDARGVIVDVKQMVPCTQDPCTLYSSRSPYVASVEVAASLLTRTNVHAGDRVTLTPA